MRIPTLDALPPPPPGKTGWPWTETARRSCPSVAFGTWPKLSIVTPSFNQAEFLEETIRSVLLQGYPNLEYFVVDGGSTDESVDIIRRYEPWLSGWTSAPDEGQVHAIQEGWSRCTGDILAYLNSDDTYLPGALQVASRCLQEHPEAVAVCGGELRIDREGFVVCERFPSEAMRQQLLEFRSLPQPAVFLRREALERCGGVDVRFQLVFDYELWLRLVELGPIAHLPEVIATTRVHGDTKTLTRRTEIAEEAKRVREKVLLGMQGKSLSSRERRKFSAALGLLLITIYLDDCPRHLRPLTGSFSLVLHSPLATLRAIRLLLGRAFRTEWTAAFRPSSAGSHDRAIREPRRIHWSRWGPACRSADSTLEKS